MGTSFIPLCAIIAVLIIAFLFASLPQVNHKTRYRVLYAIAIIMLLAVIPISEYMAEDTKNSSNNYLLVLIFDIAVGYFCMYIAALLKFNVLKRKNQALENALTEKQQENVAILLEHQNEKQQALQQRELENVHRGRTESYSCQCLRICRTRFDNHSLNNHSANKYM